MAQRRFGIPRSGTAIVGHDTFSTRYAVCQSELANPKEFKSYKDLLDPKWKGKIIADDPRKSRPGQATFTFFFLHPELGVKFIRAIAGQGLTLLRDYAQEVNMLGQGRYAIGLGFSDSLAEQRAKQRV